MISQCVLGLATIWGATVGQLGEGEGYLKAIRTTSELDKVATTASALPGVDLSTKCLVPAQDGDPDLLPVLFQNVHVYPFHFEFLLGEFRDKFTGLTANQYLEIVEKRAARKYYALLLYRFKGPEPTYGFDIFTEGGNPAELPLPAEVKWVFDHVTPLFQVGVLAYSPRDPVAVKNAEGWVDPGFPINFAFGGGIPDFIPYVRAEGFGRVKIFDKAGFDEANESGAFSFQDIVVLDHTPSDIEGVIAGALTSTLQDGLGHLAIRTARRGSPNAYLKDAPRIFKPLEGKLIHLKVGTTGYEVSEATLEEAEAWWSSHRPKLEDITAADTAYRPLDFVGDIPLDGPVPLVSRYGGKGANFARLFSLLEEKHRVPAFIVPFYYYTRFLEQNQTRSLKNPNLRVTYAKYLEELLADPEFKADSKVRFERLEELRDLFEDEGRVEAAVVAAIDARIQEVFGATDKRVRFRSSSNVEDLLEFNGAGLYNSTSTCAADDLDDDSSGPSLCDPDEDKERGAARGLKRVWASLWNFRAFEEREYYQIDHLGARMAVVVSEGFPEELANGVAFTGNPDDRKDKRFVVTVQKGDTPVVFPEPGVLAEKDLLTVEGGTVRSIVRQQASTLVPKGSFVLSDDQLREVGRVMASVESQYDRFLDLGTHSRDEVVLDFELKFDLQGNLRFKQVRPFLIATSAPAAPTFKLTIPDNYTMCGGFVENRRLPEILKRKVQVGLRSGVHELRGDGSSPSDFFEWVALGPDEPRLTPEGPGVWSAVLDANDPAGASYRFSTTQTFRNGAELLTLAVERMSFTVEGAQEVSADPLFLTNSISPSHFSAAVEYGDPPDVLTRTPLLPCNLDHLPLWTVDFEFGDGTTVHLEERFQDLEEGTGPAEVQVAEVTLPTETQTIQSYWKLCYTAGHHNDTPYPAYWILFNLPVEVDGVGTAYGIEIIEFNRLPHPPPIPEAYYLAEDHSRLAPLEVLTATRLKEGSNPLLFVRGDVDFDRDLRITDAIFLLRYLFQGGFLTCQDAGDVDDDGSLGLTDPILLLEFLYQGGDPPLPPYPDCGLDEFEDNLSACAGPGC